MNLIPLKRKIALVFGGQSTEFEVSLSSAIGILNAIPKEKYEVFPIRISREGQWDYLGKNTHWESPEKLEKANGIPVMMTYGGFTAKDKQKPETEDLMSIDAVFPILHGTLGEDGTFQGMCRMMHLPCVGAGVAASALGLDKVFMKQLFIQNDLLTPDFLWFLRKNWQRNKTTIMKGISQEIGYPCFVKPANAGSSVGVFKIEKEDKLEESINKATEFDRKILVEKAVNARELECSVLGNDDVKASIVGEIIPSREFYDYEAKYIDASETKIPADINETLVSHIQKMAVQAFKTLDCAGMARVDFLLDKDTGDLYLNEINTLPGFTPISMYPQLWEKSGISYSDLIHQLIQLAIERDQDLNNTRLIRNQDQE